MLYNNQFNYDNAMEPELSNYQDEPLFAKFVEYVTLELADGRDWQNLNSEVMLTYLKWGYQAAYDWVYEQLTEKQYLEYLEELNEY